MPFLLFAAAFELKVFLSVFFRTLSSHTCFFLWKGEPNKSMVVAMPLDDVGALLSALPVRMSGEEGSKSAHLLSEQSVF